ncbi:MAG: inorganic diphosphatase [Bacteroidota bacterium]
MNRWVVLVFVWVLIGCSSKQKDYEAISPIDNAGNLNVIIETPANTKSKVQYNFNTKKFVKSNDEFTTNALTNLGFIPIVGQKLDVLVIGEPQKTGEVVPTQPLALLELKNDGSSHYFVISKFAQHGSEIKDFDDFASNFLSYRKSISNWVKANYELPENAITFWYDEAKVIQFISNYSS